MGLNFLHVSDHNWAEKMLTDMRNRTMAYLERRDKSLILAPLLTTLKKRNENMPENSSQRKI